MAVKIEVVRHQGRKVFSLDGDYCEWLEADRFKAGDTYSLHRQGATIVEKGTIGFSQLRQSNILFFKGMQHARGEKTFSINALTTAPFQLGDVLFILTEKEN